MRSNWILPGWGNEKPEVKPRKHLHVLLRLPFDGRNTDAMARLAKAPGGRVRRIVNDDASITVLEQSKKTVAKDIVGLTL